MTECALCGRRAAKKAVVEGSIIEVCRECIRFGKEVRAPRVVMRRPAAGAPLIDEVLRSDFNKIIKREREKQKLTQRELAGRLQEKESLIRRMEEGWEPPLRLARKVGKFFGIDLIRKADTGTLKRKEKTPSLTIGDIAEVSE